MVEKTAIAIRHVHFEDLGTFAPALASAGYRVDYVDLGVDDLAALDPLAPELLIALGGPIGVYEDAAYPLMAQEISLLQARLRANRPTLGVCLGAQVMAAALGARVFPSGRKEIGFFPLTLTEAGRRGPLRFLEQVPVLHWHGDMFEVPEGATLLAASDLCPHQAFSLGPNILGTQFHPEAQVLHGFERWLIGHTVELAGAGVSPQALRQDAARFGDALGAAGRDMLSAWLEGLER